MMASTVKNEVSKNMDCELRTTDCGLGIKYGLGIKRGPESMDWI